MEGLTENVTFESKLKSKEGKEQMLSPKTPTQNYLPGLWYRSVKETRMTGAEEDERRWERGGNSEPDPMEPPVCWLKIRGPHLLQWMPRDS